MFVLDGTTLGALFDSYGPIWDAWRRVNDGEIVLGVPATAIVEVAQDRGITRSEWASILWPPSVEVLPLTEAVAVEIGTWNGLLHARHALWESQQLGWPVLTRDRGLYAPGSRVLVV